MPVYYCNTYNQSTKLLMGEGKIRSLGLTYIHYYKIDNQQGPTLLYRELYSISYNNV